MKLLKSKKYFQLIINNYPNTDYALDAKYKLDYINEIWHQKKCI